MKIVEQKKTFYHVELTGDELARSYLSAEEDGLKRSLFAAIRQADSPEDTVSLIFEELEHAQAFAERLGFEQVNPEKPKRDVEIVKSETHENVRYIVEFEKAVPVTCTCMDHQVRHTFCKHMGKAIVQRQEKALAEAASENHP